MTDPKPKLTNHTRTLRPDHKLVINEAALRRWVRKHNAMLKEWEQKPLTDAEVKAMWDGCTNEMLTEFCNDEMYHSSDLNVDSFLDWLATTVAP